jgi:hypothetical protein
MKYEVKPITITALDHCKVRVASCRGREMAVEKAMVMKCNYTDVCLGI